MATIKKPKEKKFPKKPKQSASLTVWQRWEDRCRDIQKENNSAFSEYERSKKQAESEKKKKASIIKNASLSGLKRKKTTSKKKRK